MTCHCCATCDSGLCYRESWMNNQEQNKSQQNDAHISLDTLYHSALWKRPQLNINTYHLTSIGIPDTKMRRSHDHLTFMMRIPISEKTFFYVETWRCITHGSVFYMTKIPMSNLLRKHKWLVYAQHFQWPFRNYLDYSCSISLLSSFRTLNDGLQFPSILNISLYLE